MTKNGKWPEELIAALKKHWQDAKSDRDKFKELVRNNKVLMKQKSWIACERKAERLGFFVGTKPSKRYPFSQFDETKKQELIKLLADGNVGWEEVSKKFPGFSESQFRNFAKHNSVSINKKKKEITPEEFKKNINKYTDRMLKFLREFGPANADKISDEIDISAQMVFRVVEELAHRGYQILKDPDGRFRLSTSEAKVVASEHHWRQTTRILIWSGSELGGIGQQADLLKTVYHTIVAEEKPDFIIALGNIIVGNLSAAKRNETFLELEQEYEEEYKKKKKISELLYQAQIDYVLNVVGDEAMTCPSSHKCNTYFISGLKEQSFIKQGFEDPLENICDQRREQKRAKQQDWFYFGRNMHIFRIINTGKPVGVLALTSKKNPFRGAYTRGYRPRKTSTSIAGWLINTLRTKGVNDYPRVIVWTDGVGVYTALGDSEATTFISLPKLAVTDPTELELDTPPNLGCVIVDFTFDEHGELKPNGIEWKFRNLAPYIKERGY